MNIPTWILATILTQIGLLLKARYYISLGLILADRKNAPPPIQKKIIYNIMIKIQSNM